MLAYIPGGGIRLGQILPFLPAIAPTINPAESTPVPAPAPTPAAPSGGGEGALMAAGALVAGVGLVSLALSAGGTWVGIHTGIKEKGFLSFTGWTVGIMSGLSGLSTLAMLVGGLVGAAAVAASARPSPSYQAPLV